VGARSKTPPTGWNVIFQLIGVLEVPGKMESRVGWREWTVRWWLVFVKISLVGGCSNEYE
jgi:hypothetical protein